MSHYAASLVPPMCTHSPRSMRSMDDSLTERRVEFGREAVGIAADTVDALHGRSPRLVNCGLAQRMPLSFHATVRSPRARHAWLAALLLGCSSRKDRLEP
jgi:hypothetical protein